MSFPKTFKAAVFEELNKPLAIREVPFKLPDQGEILIKVDACGVCHSDASVQAGHFGALPRIPGHEVVGRVVAVGPEEKKWKVGDRVGGAWHGGHDGACRQCNTGLFQMCDNQQINGVTRDGGYAEYCLLRTEAAVRLPEEGSAAELAPLMCAGVTVYNGIRKMNIVSGEVVAVQGLGGLGHLAIQYARQMGYRTVAMSRGTDKKDFAIKLGATDYIDTSKEDAAEALQKMGGAALIVVTAPNPEVITPLINGCKALGKVLILA
ncbi:GroES-like protein, partial [Violaceomyces palustris]